jgi:hypothetical protein
MITARRFARILVRLTLPVALFAVAGAPEIARATPEQSCVYGHDTQYFDAFGNVCAASNTCAGWQWGSCDDDLTFALYNEDVILCYCD